MVVAWQGWWHAVAPQRSVAISNGGMMIAPGSGGGSHISRGTFESNPQGYFASLHGSGKGNK